MQLLSGLVFFLLTLGRICFLRLGKILLAVVFTRVFSFVVTFFLIFTLFVLYNIYYTFNRDSIEQWYENYFGCLTGTSLTNPSKCISLAGPEISFPFLILRGLALSSVGTLLFLNFLSWEMFRHWYAIFSELLGARNRAEEDDLEVHSYDKCIHLVANIVNED